MTTKKTIKNHETKEGPSSDALKQFFESVQEQIKSVTSKGQAPFTIQHSYLSDLSYESPDAKDFFLNGGFQDQPGERKGRLDMGVDYHVIKKPLFESVIKARMELAFSDRKRPLMLVEIHYNTFARLEESLGSEASLFVLHCEIPRLAFPFLQRIIFDLAREGAIPPPQIRNFDYQELFIQYILKHGLPQLKD